MWGSATKGSLPIGGGCERNEFSTMATCSSSFTSGIVAFSSNDGKLTIGTKNICKDPKQHALQNAKSLTI